MMEFFLPIEPPTATHQMKKVTVVRGKPRFYEPPQLAQAREQLISHLQPYRPIAPLTGALRLETRWSYPCKRGRHDGDWKTTRPDTDNMVKLLKDCMTALGFWLDDALVCDEHIRKVWAAQPGLYVKVERLESQEKVGGT
ncbi:MAG: RusA family crossover junction endodeoxyribonuclease [Oscillospiraceae bacterium]|jgi:Holliday junction resolvase RusA-like endonuclease|nr:RusA family crossover junction endodeoxyribonuclease [Oscillospiraceae bacterium]